MSDTQTTDNDVKRAAKGDTLAKGRFRFVTDQTRLVEKANKNGYRQVVSKVYPLKDVDDAGSADFRVSESLWIPLPIRNPDIEGHTVDGKTLRDAATTFNALFPERIVFVGKKKEDGSYKTDAEYEEEKELQLMEVQTLAKEILSNPSMLDDHFFYASTTPKDKGNGNWLNYLSPQLFGDQELTPPEKFIA